MKVRDVDHHDCGVCGVTVSYTRKAADLYFNSGCECSWSPPQWRSWDSAVEWINMQGAPEWQEKIAARFGLTPNV